MTIMRRYAWGVAAAALVTTACAKGKGAPGGGPGGGGPPPMPVEVAVARADTVRDEIAATGQVEAMQSILLRPEVEGRIVAILVREGEEVPAGTPLLQIDSTELAARAAQLAAQRDLAEQALTRTKDLVTQNASSAADLERAEATARSAAAEYRLAQIRLERSTVRAPFGGFVGQRFVSLGDYVTSSTELVTLQTINPQRVAFQVPERYARALREGQAVTFGVAAIPGRTFTGLVDFVNPVIQLPGRTILVKARVPNPERILQAGMFVEAHLVTAVRPKAVVVPEEAVIAVQGANLIWVVADNKAAPRPVQIGVRIPGLVEITGGLQAGEQVVVGGAERLFPGATVMAQMRGQGPTVGAAER